MNNGQSAKRCPQAHPFWLYDGTKIAQGVPVSQLEPVQFNISEIPPINPEESEDCLFLDVMVPQKIFDSRQVKGGNWIRDAEKRTAGNGNGNGAPVLVWIDGGGFSAGYKHEQEPAGLIARSQSEGDGIIYVGINYRVGLFVSKTPSLE